MSRTLEDKSAVYKVAQSRSVISFISGARPGVQDRGPAAPPGREVMNELFQSHSLQLSRFQKVRRPSSGQGRGGGLAYKSLGQQTTERFRR